MQYSQETVGYARVSTHEQFAVNQIDEMKKCGISIFFFDEGVSGKTMAMDRPEFKAMIEYIKEHNEVKRIVVYEVSRLGRNMLDSITTFITIEQRGLHIISLTEEWTQQEDPEIRPLLVMIMSWVNAKELDRLSKRTKLGMERVRKYGSESGKPIGRPAIIPVRSEVIAMREGRLDPDGKPWPWCKIAAHFKMDSSTLYRYRKKWKAQDLGR